MTGATYILLNSRRKVEGKEVKLRDAILQLVAQVDSLRGCEVYQLAHKRHASKPEDKVSGLFISFVP